MVFFCFAFRVDVLYWDRINESLNAKTFLKIKVKKAK